MNRVMKNDRGNEEDHLNQERPVQVVHVGVRREQQQAGKEHHHQTTKCPQPSVSGELSGIVASHCNTQQRKIHDRDSPYREGKPDDVEALKNREGERGRIERIGDQHLDTRYCIALGSPTTRAWWRMGSYIGSKSIRAWFNLIPCGGHLSVSDR